MLIRDDWRGQSRGSEVYSLLPISAAWEWLNDLRDYTDKQIQRLNYAEEVPIMRFR